MRGRPINRMGFGEIPLASAAKRHFGSWRSAVTAAGLAHRLAAPRTVRRWTKDAVLRAILSRQRQGLPLANAYKDDSGFYSAAKKYFGSWTDALRAAGLPPTRIQWTKERVVAEIRTWRKRGVTISRISAQDMRLTVAAIRLFGNWHSALIAAGIDAKPSSRKRREVVRSGSLRSPTMSLVETDKGLQTNKKGAIYVA